MTDDLPVDIDDEVTDENGEGAGVWTWILGAGGVVAAIYILSAVFNFLVWLTGYALQAAVVLLVLYAGYRGLNYLLSDGETASRQKALPGESDLDQELENLTSEEVGASDLEDLDASAAEVQLGGVESSDDDELEQKFAELEREMADE